MTPALLVMVAGARKVDGRAQALVGPGLATPLKITHKRTKELAEAIQVNTTLQVLKLMKNIAL